MRRRALRIVGDLGLTLAALGGVVCIVGVVAAAFFHISLIMFQTGSMSPTIPAGSLAVVAEVSAADVEVGDVVTVDREGQLPITHRVTSIKAVDAGAGGSGAERVITMRGDANAQDDAEPYTVSHVRTVLFSLPGWAPTVDRMGHPLVMGGVTLAVAGLITWSMWPRDGRRARHAAGRVAALVVVGGVIVAPLAGAPPAQAADTETVFRGRWIVLTSLGDSDQLGRLTTGRDVTWQVGVSSTAPEPGRLHAELSADGPLTDHLSVRVRSCTVRWERGVCRGTGANVMPWGGLGAGPGTGAGGVHSLVSLDAHDQRWLLFDVRMDTAARSGDSAHLRVHAWGGGDSVSGGTDTGSGAAGGSPGRGVAAAGAEGGLAATGRPAALIYAVLGGGLVLAAGLTMARRPHARNRGSRKIAGGVS